MLDRLDPELGRMSTGLYTALVDCAELVVVVCEGEGGERARSRCRGGRRIGRGREDDKHAYHPRISVRDNVAVEQEDPGLC